MVSKMLVVKIGQFSYFFEKKLRFWVESGVSGIETHKLTSCCLLFFIIWPLIIFLVLSLYVAMEDKEMLKENLKI